MSSADTVEQVTNQLKNAKTFAAIFGSLPSGNVREKRGALRKQFAYLINLVHPDHVPPTLAKKAGEVVQRLTELHAAAKAAVDAGKYDAPFAAGAGAKTFSPEVILQSPLAVYRLRAEPLKEGDFSVLYQGHAVGTSEEVIIKIAAVPEYNTWLEAELRALKRFSSAGAGTPLQKIGRFIPQVLDTFLVSDENNRRVRAIVLPHLEGYVSVTDIVEAFPGGLDPRDAAWISRRLIAQVLAAQAANMVHGAIVPDHLLVSLHSHDPLHIGWAHALDDPKTTGNRITRVIDRYRDWYPEEVFRKEVPDFRTDLYMAGKTMIKLLGGDTKRNTFPLSVPDQLKRIILRCVETSPARRPSNGMQFLDELTSVVRNLWGKAWRPLSMPPR